MSEAVLATSQRRADGADGTQIHLSHFFYSTLAVFQTRIRSTW